MKDFEILGYDTVVALIESGVQPGIFVENFKIKH